MKMPINPSRQQGVSLVVTLVLVVLLSLLALYGAGVLVLDTRSAANDYRAKEALAAAETGLDQGYSLLSINRRRIGASGLDANNDGDVADATDSGWTTCSGSATTAPCVAIRSDDRGNWSYLTLNSALTVAPTQGSFTLYLMTPSSGDSNMLVYNIVAQGLSADGSSRAIAKQGAYFYPLIVSSVDSPLSSASNVPLSGNYSIVTNSNGGGSGVPVSVWTGTTISVTGNGSYSTCHLGDFFGGACQSDTALSMKNQYGADLVQDPDFPADLFRFLFGVDAADYQQIKDQATVAADCSALTDSSEGLQWVTGNCNPPGDVGSASRPVLLVAQADTTLNAGSNFYGLLFMFDPAGGTPRLISNGNATLHGAIIAYDNVDLQLNGGFVLEYNAAVLSALSNNTSSRGLTRLPGSWSDVQ